MLNNAHYLKNEITEEGNDNKPYNEIKETASSSVFHMLHHSHHLFFMHDYCKNFFIYIFIAWKGGELFKRIRRGLRPDTPCESCTIKTEKNFREIFRLKKIDLYTKTRVDFL